MHTQRGQQPTFTFRSLIVAQENLGDLAASIRIIGLLFQMLHESVQSFDVLLGLLKACLTLLGIAGFALLDKAVIERMIGDWLGRSEGDGAA